MSGPGAAWRLAVGTLTVFPVRPVEVDRAVAGRAMSLAPFVGLLLGLAAAVVLAVAGAVSGSPLLGAVLAVAALAWLTRALHLDGLADLADGLGSGRPADGALEVMKRSDIGPFGVVTVVIALLVQVAALSRGGAVAWVALVAAAVTGRLAVTWACREGVPPARPTGLGALVAGTVRRGAAIGTTLVSAAVVAVLALVAAIGAPAFCVPAADGARVVLDLGALFPAGFDSLGNDYGYPVSANGGPSARVRRSPACCPTWPSIRSCSCPPGCCWRWPPGWGRPRCYAAGPYGGWAASRATCSAPWWRRPRR
ncbi:hypothetical protein GCM10027612_36810 [Microbispora bryophytorum subsp. camponoti]